MRLPVSLSPSAKVVFRADASAKIGTGHVARCLALAGELRKRGVDCTFVSRTFSSNCISLMRDAGFPVIELEVETDRSDTWLGARLESEIAATERALRTHQRSEWLIVDHYALDVRWERAMRPYADRILVIDDLADRMHDADVLLDTTWLPPGTADRYNGLVAPETVRLYGPRYALLRPEFGTENRRLRSAGVARVLLFFGGFDAGDVTSTALDAALRMDRSFAIDVVVGGANPRARQIEQRAAGRAVVHVETTRMAHLMAEADLALGAGGTTSWERLWLGLPALVVSVADNQVAVAEELDRAGAVRYLGGHTTVDASRWMTEIDRLVREPEQLAAMSRTALRISGAGPLGTEAVVAAMAGLSRVPAG